VAKRIEISLAVATASFTPSVVVFDFALEWTLRHYPGSEPLSNVCPLGPDLLFSALWLLSAGQRLEAKLEHDQKFQRTLISAG